MPFRLKAQDAKELEASLHGGVQHVRVVLRALALLHLHRGASAPEVARLVALTPPAVRKIAQRYRTGGLASALYERPGPGAAAGLAPGEKQRIVAMACSAPPPGAARWTVRLIAQEAIKRNKRCGTANLFGVVAPQAGRHFTCATPDCSAAQFARMMQRVITAYPRTRTIPVVRDNLNIHGEKSLTDQFGRRLGRRLWRRVPVHFTPKHGSWLNQAELELSWVSRGCLGRRRIADLTHLSSEVRAWNTCAKRARTRIQWRFTRKDA